MLTIKLRLPFSPCVQCAWIAGAQSFVYLWQSFERFIQPPSVRREGVVWHPALRLTCHACRINSRGPLTSRTPPRSLSVWKRTYYLSQQVDHSVWAHHGHSRLPTPQNAVILVQTRWLSVRWARISRSGSCRWSRVRECRSCTSGSTDPDRECEPRPRQLTLSRKYRQVCMTSCSKLLNNN